MIVLKKPSRSIWMHKYQMIIDSKWLDQIKECTNMPMCSSIVTYRCYIILIHQRC